MFLFVFGVACNFALFIEFFVGVVCNFTSFVSSGVSAYSPFIGVACNFTMFVQFVKILRVLLGVH